MFAFGLMTSPVSGDVAVRRLDRMMTARGDAPDGAAAARAPHAAAAILRWAVTKRDRGVAPHWDAERQLLVAGDVRLYNRAEVRLELADVRADAEASDLELARLAYLAWGARACERLVGDFAFAVWDERRRSLFVARDHLGVRPLYYRTLADGVAVASDVRQLLCLTTSALALVEERKILDRFTGRQRRHGRTFYKEIALLRPGHYGVFEDGGFRETRYWRPPSAEDERPYADQLEGVREAFLRAVGDRLEADGPIVAHSSGGYDSSSIIVAADRICAQGGGCAALVMTSGLVRGTVCDESRFMDALARRVRFESHSWNALEPDTSHITDPILVRPGQGRGVGGGPRGDLRLAAERGARVLLSGDFGDTIMFASGLRRDMVRRLRWGTLAAETLGKRSPADAARLLARAALGVLPPRAALDVTNRAFGRRRPAPSWFGPALRALYPPGPEELEVPDQVWPSHLMCELWTRIQSPHLSACHDFTVQYGANEGVEVRMPYADVRLVERVLRIPARQRLERGDVWSLRADAFGAWMPSEFKTRPPQEPWTPVFARAARFAFHHVERLLSDGTWLSAPYVDRREAAMLLALTAARGDDAAPRDCIQLSEIGALEAWLRLLLRYDLPREVET